MSKQNLIYKRLYSLSLIGWQIQQKKIVHVISISERIFSYIDNTMCAAVQGMVVRPSSLERGNFCLKQGIKLGNFYKMFKNRIFLSKRLAKLRLT